LLHTHSWYSLLEGVSSLDALLARAAACGYTALALTDTNNFYGAVAFVEAAARYQVRPLLGACLRHQSVHCVALIAEPAGWSSLCRILTRLHLREDADLARLLAENAAGLHVLADDPALARQLREAFGVRLWLEVVRPGPGNRPRRHHEQREHELLCAGRRLGLRPVASTAVHFATAGEYEVFRLVTAVRQGGLLAQLPRRLSITPDHHLVDKPTLQQRFRDLPEALANLTELTGQLGHDVLPRQTVLPPAKIPRGLQEQQYLRRLCERGLHHRGLYGDPAAHERLGEELAIIDAGSLAPYFLVVRDIARHARHRRLTMALRGSAGNSLVCYLLEITDVNPLRFQLALDRFLHIGRPDLPDIDLDFDWRVRDEIINHVFERYGPAHTAMISSHLFLQPRSAFREAGKIHGLSNEQITEIVVSGQWSVDSEAEAEPPTHHQAPTPNHQPLITNHYPLTTILRDARLLLGRPHHLSVHPGGIVITPRPIEEYVPVQRAAKGVLITQFEKDAAEATGLVKIDLLGNRALANVDEIAVVSGQWLVDSEEESGVRGQGSEVRDSEQRAAASLTTNHYPLTTSSLPTTHYPLPTNPPLTPDLLQLLKKGDTLGVNQLESPAMRHLLIQLQPRGIEDVICALALIRPGAGAIGMKGRYVQRRCGGEPVPPLPACLEPVLRETYGLLVYQDDALGMIRALTGLSVPETHRFYKRVTKIKPHAEPEVYKIHPHAPREDTVDLALRVRQSELAQEDRRLAEEFRQLCLARGIDEATIAEQWLLLTHFRRYTFCKSHAVSYGLIAWRCAYAKVHHPLAFWTAVLNNNQGVYPRRVYVEALKRAGLRILLPCINRSEEKFTSEQNSIRTGLGAIATLPEETRQRILTERQRGLYRDLADFRRRVQPGPEALAVLIRSGALDFIGRARPGLFLEADLLDHAATVGKGELFDDVGELAWLPGNYDIVRRRRDEWQLLGFIADVPMLSLYRPHLPRGLVRSIDLPRYKGRRIRTAGLVATGRFAYTEKGLEMQFITLEDEWGLMEVTLFPGTCELLTNLTLGPYLVTGVVDEQFGVFTLTAESRTEFIPPKGPQYT
jgi:DNA polymerase III alpha subunit